MMTRYHSYCCHSEAASWTEGSFDVMAGIEKIAWHEKLHTLQVVLLKVYLQDRLGTSAGFELD